MPRNPKLQAAEKRLAAARDKARRRKLGKLGRWLPVVPIGASSQFESSELRWSERDLAWSLFPHACFRIARVETHPVAVGTQCRDPRAFSLDKIGGIRQNFQNLPGERILAMPAPRFLEQGRLIRTAPEFGAMHDPAQSNVLATADISSPASGMDDRVDTDDRRLSRQQSPGARRLTVLKTAARTVPAPIVLQVRRPTLKRRATVRARAVKTSVRGGSLAAARGYVLARTTAELRSAGCNLRWPDRESGAANFTNSWGGTLTGHRAYSSVSCPRTATTVSGAFAGIIP